MKLAALMKMDGIDEALLGLGLSYNIIPEDYNKYPIGTPFRSYPEEVQNKIFYRAMKLITKDGGHNKFIESIQLWLDLRLPRYLWSQFDTYRISTKQSQSTMHTITNRELTHSDFYKEYISQNCLDEINKLINKYNNEKDKDIKYNYFMSIKNILPEGYIQRREVNLSLKTLRNIYTQRVNHRIHIWRQIFTDIYSSDKAYYNIDNSEFNIVKLALGIPLTSNEKINVFSGENNG